MGFIDSKTMYILYMQRHQPPPVKSFSVQILNVTLTWG